MFNVGALTATHRTDRMSANPISILGKATFAVPTMCADDVTRKSEGTRPLVRIARIGRIAFPSGGSVHWSASNFSSSPIPPFVTFSVIDWKKMSDSEVEIIISCLLIDEEGKQKTKRKRVWVHNICKKTTDCGEYHSNFPDLIVDDVKVFQYFRMTHEKFTVVRHLLKPDISRENTSFREAVGPKERL
jgi:hypothetical protein